MPSQIKHNHFYKCILIFLAISAVTPSSIFSQDEEYHLFRLLKLARMNPTEKLPKQKIYLQNGVVYCTGKNKLSIKNNEAAALMEKGEYEPAVEIIENGLKYAALFFPFRYNLGVCHLHLGKLKRALIHFRKAQGVVPEYSKTYLQIGNIYARLNRDSEAIEHYREALKRNSKELNTFILIGDIFFKRNQLEMAKKYYDASLKINHRYPNGLLGRAKVYFRDGRLIKAMVLLNTINTSGEYDKSLHYYYAESAFKLQDYKTASEQYKMLLKFKNDRFFLTNSTDLIEHKLNLSSKFSGQ